MTLKVGDEVRLFGTQGPVGYIEQAHGDGTYTLRLGADAAKDAYIARLERALSTLRRRADYVRSWSDLKAIELIDEALPEDRREVR